MKGDTDTEGFGIVADRSLLGFVNSIYRVDSIYSHFITSMKKS